MIGASLEPTVVISGREYQWLVRVGSAHLEYGDAWEKACQVAALPSSEVEIRALSAREYTAADRRAITHALRERGITKIRWFRFKDGKPRLVARSI